MDKVPNDDLAVYVARNEGGVSEFRSVGASEIRELVAEGADVFMEIGALESRGKMLTSLLS